MRFSAPYDTTSKVVSAVLAVVLLLVFAVTHNVLIACVAIVLYAGTYAFSPRGYVVSEGAITVERLARNVRIPLDDLREARTSRFDDLTGVIRLFGDGGLFGYYGLFRTSKLGRCWWYVTDRNRTVVVITASKKLVFSPDDPGRFVEAVRAAAPVAWSR